MSQAQLANLLITNNQVLGCEALNSVQMYNALVQAGVSEEIAKATVKQVLQTQATNAQTTATVAATGATGGFKTALIGLGTTLKAFAIAHPIITAITAIVAIIGTAVFAYKKYNEAIQESIEKAQELQDAYKQASDEISDKAKPPPPCPIECKLAVYSGNVLHYQLKYGAFLNIIFLTAADKKAPAQPTQN